MDPEVIAEIERGVVDCYAYIDALIELRRGDPGDNLVTDLIRPRRPATSSTTTSSAT